MKHSTFRLACGARSVNHICKAIWTRQVDRFRIGHFCHEVVDEECLGGSGVEVAFGLFCLKYLMCRYQDFRLGVFQHITQSLVRIFKIQRCIGCTGFMDGKHRQRELLQAVEHHADEVVGLHAEIDKLTCQCVGVPVHLAVSQLAVAVNNGRRVRCAFCLFGKEICKGFCDINVDILASANFDDTLRFLVAHHADAVDVGVGLSHHVFHRGFDGISHDTHLFAAVHRQTRLHSDVVVVTSEEDMCKHVIKHVATVLFHQRTVCVAEVECLFPSRQGGEVE